MSLSWVTFPEMQKVLATTATTIAEAVTTFLAATCDFLFGADSVTDLGYDPVLDLLATAVADQVNVINPRTGKRVALIDVGETVNRVSMYDGAVWVATPTKGIYYADYLVDLPQNAGGAGLVDGLLWSTAQDSNPDWTGPAYTPPALFLVEADAVGWQVWDVGSGTPVSDSTQALLNISSLAYDEGNLYVGTSAGAKQYGWWNDSVTDYTTATTPAIVNDTVNDVAAKVVSATVTNKILWNTDLSNAVWEAVRCTANADKITEDSTPAATHVINQLDVQGPVAGFVTLSCSASSVNRGVELRMLDFVTGDPSVKFDLQTGTAVEVSGDVVDFGIVSDNGEYFCWIVAEATGGQVDSFFYMNKDGNRSYDGDGTSQVRLRDTILQQGNKPHRNISTEGTAVTATVAAARQTVNNDLGGGEFSTTDTGLSVPTLPIATAGNAASVVVDSGESWDITGFSVSLGSIGFTNQGEILTYQTSGGTVGVYDVPTTDMLNTAYKRRYFSSNSPASDPGAPKVLRTGGANIVGYFSTSATGVAFGSEDGLTLIEEDITDYFKGLELWAASTYNKGFTKQTDGAWACDNNTDPIGFPFDLYEDFDDETILIFQDDFNRTTLGDWTDASTAPANIDVSSSRLNGNAVGGNTARAQLNLFPTVIDKWYRIARTSTGTHSFFAGSSVPGSTDYFILNQLALDATFKATTTELFVSLTGTDDFSIDNFIIEEVPALDGWEPFFDAGVSIENGQVHVTKDDTISGSGARILKAFPVVAGKHYNLFAGYGEALVGTVAEVAVSETEATGTALARIQTTTSFNNQLASFTAADSELNLLLVTSSNLGDESVFDNITVQEAILENGAFDTDISGWTVTQDGTGTATWNSGAVVMTRDVGLGNMGRISQDFTTVIGRTYRASTIIDANDDSTVLLVGTAENGNQNLVKSTTGTGELADFFIATATTSWVTVRPFADSMSCTIDNVIVTEGLPDYSIADNPLQVIGQVTRESTCDPADPTCCIEAVVIDDKNYLKGQVATPGELAGFEKIDGTYQQRTQTALWENASETAGELEIRSQERDVSVPVYQLRWNQ